MEMQLKAFLASLIDHWLRPHHASGGFCELGCGSDVSGGAVAAVWLYHSPHSTHALHHRYTQTKHFASLLHNSVKKKYCDYFASYCGCLHAKTKTKILSSNIFVSLLNLVLGEANLFETLNQMNLLLRKMIHCFERLHALVTPAGQTCMKAPFTKRLHVFLKM